MIDYIITHQEEILLAATSIVTAASVIVKLTPTPKDDAFFAGLLKVLNFLAISKKVP
jgi:hypothetical protein